MKDYTTIKKWNDDYNGAGIYSLIDESGKRYIGQAKHVQQRLESHRCALNLAVRKKDAFVNDGIKLVDAVRNGVKFRVEILKKIPWYDATTNILRKWESYYLDYFGGIDKTYNGAVVPYPSWKYDPYNDVTVDIIINDAEIAKRLNTINGKQEYIKNLIREDIGT